MAFASAATAAVRAAAKALDIMVQQRAQALTKRKGWLSDLETSGYKDKVLLAELEDDASERQALMQALAILEASLKNADGVLAEMDKQAKKDSETINKGASLAGGSSAKAKAICKQLADSLGPVQQKASYAKTEFDNLLAKIRVDKNLGRDQLAKIGAKAYKEVDEIGQSLETLTSNLDSVIGELRDVGS